MPTPIVTQVTAQGLLIPHAAIREWLEQEIEVIKEGQSIIIRPRARSLTNPERIHQILATNGLLLPVEPLPPTYTPLSPQEKNELTRKFSVGQPLSKIISQARADRV